MHLNDFDLTLIELKPHEKETRHAGHSPTHIAVALNIKFYDELSDTGFVCIGVRPLVYVGVFTVEYVYRCQ